MTKSDVRSGGLDRVLVLEVARVTEAAAIAAAKLRGRGDVKAADGAAVDAMRRELAKVHIRGRVVIGEGEMDESPMLYIGEEVGVGDGPEVDIAVDPLEGTTICAKGMPNALAVLAISERGGLLNAPDMYMHKIAIGPGYPEGVLAAAALRCIGGQMQARLAPDLHAEKERPELIERARKMGIPDIRRKYSMQEMASGDVIFSATGVTDGSLLDGVHFRGDFAETETVVLRSKTGTVRRIKTTFRMIGTK